MESYHFKVAGAVHGQNTTVHAPCVIYEDTYAASLIFARAQANNQQDTVRNQVIEEPNLVC